VQGGARWEEVLSALERGRLEFLDHPYGSVFSSLRLGTDALTQMERARYFELAVFPEKADIPVETVCTLWRHTGRMEPDVSRDLLRRLHRRALLTLHEDSSGISFHDLQHDFLRLNIPSLVKGHTALVDAYRAIAPPGWARAPDDGYFFQYLPQHLAAADRLDELRALLSDYDWLAVKLRATNITALLADYDLVANGPDFALIQHALRLSIPALSRDGAQLPGQLLGRLRGADSPAIQTLVTRAESGPGRVWLRPRFASLTPPGGPLRQTLVGHTGWVASVVALPNDGYALSASADHTLRLWDLASGETLRTLEGHTDWVLAVTALADARRALSGSADKTLRLWDLETKETVRTLKGHTGPVNAVAMLPDGRRALTGSNDNTVLLWDVDAGQTLRVLVGHTHSVTAAVALSDGRHALSGSNDNTLRLWDLDTGQTVRVLEGHTHSVTTVTLLADGKHALSGSWDNTLWFWNLWTGESERIPAYAGAVDTLTLVADGRQIP